jgi:hypothetical protein
MSLDYSFYISTRLSPENLMRAFLLSLGFPWDPSDGCEAHPGNFHAWVGPARGGRSRQIKLERFGFAPDVHFEFNTWGGVDFEGRAEIVRGALAVCRAIPGDAVLLFNGEQVLFTRLAGTIYVNSLYWEGDYALFPPPYELKAIPVD